MPVSSLSALTILTLLLPLQAENSTHVRKRSVLFVGNSFTFRLDQVLAKVAQSAGRQLKVETVAQGGWTLKKHSESERTLKAIRKGRWDFVVLQEQSQIPSFPEAQRTQLMDGPAVRLCKEVREAGAVPLFFMTWAAQNGDSRNRKDDSFDAMQMRLKQGYEKVAAVCKAEVVPVGMAWLKAEKSGVTKGLYSRDGKHQGSSGAYLNASVFFAYLFRANPIGIRYRSGVSAQQAMRLQTIALKVVKEQLVDSQDE
ncbi:MAG: hypothetical protein QF437_23220 [Planctomycetota bacterium]|nr:hypothetical protein [Planctomycetota bacterium]